MSARRLRFAGLAALLTAVMGFQAPTQGQAPTRPAAPAVDPFAGLKFRNIGPATMGGRVDDLAVLESNPGGLLRRHRHRRPVEDDQQRHDLGGAVRRPR